MSIPSIIDRRDLPPTRESVIDPLSQLLFGDKPSTEFTQSLASRFEGILIAEGATKVVREVDPILGLSWELEKRAVWSDAAYVDGYAFSIVISGVRSQTFHFTNTGKVCRVDRDYVVPERLESLAFIAQLTAPRC